MQQNATNALHAKNGALNNSLFMLSLGLTSVVSRTASRVVRRTQRIPLRPIPSSRPVVYKLRFHDYARKVKNNHDFALNTGITASMSSIGLLCDGCQKPFAPEKLSQIGAFSLCYSCKMIRCEQCGECDFEQVNSFRCSSISAEN